MRSLAERARVAAEWVLRAALLGLLVWSFVRAIAAQSHRGTESATSATLGEALRRWSTVRAPERVHVALDQPPSGRDRDWLAALEGAGTSVSWSGAALVPTAVAMEPRADPAGGADVSVAAPGGATIVLRDTAGTIDSARAATASGIRAIVSRPRATVEAVVGRVAARAGARDSLQLRRLLVLGAAQWETKFVVAALEERGWLVDAHIALSPKGDVRQGTIAAIDTARYSAVVAVDSTAAPYGDRVAAFVRQGGGLVLWAPAARGGALARIAAGAPGEVIPDDGTAPSDSAPRRGLAFAPIVRLLPDAVVLERRPEGVALAARRAGLGRVIETGYLDSWRWRMAGGEDAPAAHRAWLAGLVAAVAHAGRTPLTPPPTDAAPLATLIDRVGPPSAAPPDATGTGTAPHPGWIFAILCALALAEWGSRRLRGAR